MEIKGSVSFLPCSDTEPATPDARQITTNHPIALFLNGFVIFDEDPPALVRI
jgi:hypothetical protein